MADDAINVKITASIDGLTAGLDAAKDRIDGMLAPVNRLASSFTGIGEAVIGGLALDRIVAFSNRMAELGAQAEHTSQMLGISAADVGAFSFAAGAMGVSSEGAAMALERFERNLVQAAGGAQGPATAAFKALGISVTDASGKVKTLDEILPEIAEKFAAAANGPEKTAIAMALLGRTGAQMIPFLNQGAAGLERFRAIAEETGTVLSDATARGFEESEIKSFTLGKAVEGLGLQFYDRLRPAIDAVTQGLTNFVERLTAAAAVTRVLTISGLVKKGEAPAGSV